MKIKYVTKLIALTGVFILSACGTTLPSHRGHQAENSPHRPISSEQIVAPDKQILITQADNIYNLLKSKQYTKLTEYIHPTKGVRFSMYAYVSDNDRLFSQTDFDKYIMQPKIKFTWGEKDGTGESLIISLPDYLDTWVMQDTKFDTISINAFTQSGNSLNNLMVFYPNQPFVEYSFKGSDKWQYMDWRCLRLVFAPHEGKLYLVGVITDQWTI